MRQIILSLLFHQSLSVKVFARLSELHDRLFRLGNPERLISKLIDLANEHKGRGTTQAHFDVS